jgi:hypothetical protein
MAFNPAETDLFPPLETFLKKNGFTVHAEVVLCDISAVKNDELLVVEIKTRFNLEVILQALRRQEAADSVFIAVPSTDSRRYPRKWKDIRTLCRRLGLGVLFVHFPHEGFSTVEVALQAASFKEKRSPSSRSTILREMEQRKKNFNVGGSSRRPLVTAYRIAALKTAAALEKFGPLSPKDLRTRGACIKCGTILQKNYYGWFDRIDMGLYMVNDLGKEALRTYADVLTSLDRSD